MSKYKGLSRAILSDYSTYPLVAANIFGLGLAFVFGGRKLIQHPDLNVNPEMQATAFSDAQLSNAESFRSTNKMFFNVLNPMSKGIRAMMMPTTKKDDIWDLTYCANPVGPSLEHTNAFNDGLFSNNSSSDVIIPIELFPAVHGGPNQKRDHASN